MRASLAIVVSIAISTFAFAAESKTKSAPKSPRVFDLGQLEIEGELRRPNMSWVDSGKRVKEMLPGMHSQAFRAIEDELLAPAKIEKVREALRGPVVQGEPHVGN